MNNHVSDGGFVEYTNSTGSTFTSGTLVQLGSGYCGIATGDITDGATGILRVRGRFTVAKTTGAIAAGEAVKLGTNTVKPAAATAGNTLANGRPTAAAGSAATTITIDLWG